MRKEIKNLFGKYNFSPKKFLGQNFLISKNILRKIVQAAEISKKDTILEVGPGIGNLTIELAKELAKKVHPIKSLRSKFNGAGKVIAVEKDKRMIEILKDVLKSSNVRNVQIVKGDILKLEPRTFNLKIYKLVANIPYYLTSRLIRKFLEEKRKPKLMVLMVQKEVAQRICALPAKVFAKQKFRRASPQKMNLLAVSVQFYAKPEIISFVSKNCFFPRPKVESAIIKISNPKCQIPKPEGELFFKIVKAGFSQPRKQLVNNLSKMLKLDKEKARNWLLENKIKPTQRAETLKIEDWLKLTKGWCKILNLC